MTTDQKPEAQAVAWRYVPSEVWGSQVLTQDPKTVELALAHGREVEPLYTRATLDAAVAEAVAVERERCAQVCEEAARLSGDMSMQWAWDACAAEIRNPKDAP